MEESSNQEQVKEKEEDDLKKPSEPENNQIVSGLDSVPPAQEEINKELDKQEES